MSDTTRLIPPPRRGPRWLDLVLAAIAGSLLTVLIIGFLALGRDGAVAPAASTSSPSGSLSFSQLPSPTGTTAPTRAPATSAPATSAPATSGPATTAPTPAPTGTPAPTPPPTPPPTAAPTRSP